jgi:hypothetical protein
MGEPAAIHDTVLPLTTDTVKDMKDWLYTQKVSADRQQDGTI